MQEELKKLISALKTGKLQPETIEAYKKLLIYAETIQGISQDISQTLVGFEKLYKEVSQAPLHDLLYPKLNWDITVGKKRRGLWRPEITLHFCLSEKTKVNDYNILPTYVFPTLVWKEGNSDIHPVDKCFNGQNICERWKNQMRSALKFYGSENVRDGSEADSCNGKRYRYYRLHSGDVNFFHTFDLKVYPEWRPGKPDYTDYVEFLAENICLPYVNEYERRIREALTSEETSEVKISSDSYNKGGKN
ncbi:MAG: hypothetical protein PHU54_02415 [Candidatus Omnitrophica bacterium]|nr:hypothetical protein [Candidatus Omnitrophota bacterium]